MTCDNEELETIKALLLKGATAKTVLEVTGLTSFQYHKVLEAHPDLKVARAEGKFQKRGNYGRALVAKLGGVGPSLKGYEKVFADWLADQVPEGGTVSDVLVATAYDAFLDERDALTGNNTTEGTTP